MRKIKLTQGKYALVDDIDFEKLNQYKWSVSIKDNSSYAVRVSGSKKIIYIHRQILNPPKNMKVDHRDGNGLNNQRKNLRICTHAQNLMNRGKQKNNFSGYKGVSFDQDRKKWKAQITNNYKNIQLGRYNTKEEAYKAYIKACIKYHGEFANLG